MVDSVTLERKRRKKMVGLIVGVLVVVMFGKSLAQTIVSSSKPLPDGYVGTPPPESYAEAKWDDLKKGKWNQKSKPRVADDIAALDGQRVHVKGFLLPLHTAGAASEFFIASSPGGCYFCNPPGVAEIVMARTKDDKKMEATQLPVDVYGTLKLATGAPDDQALYLIEHGVFVVRR